jgi:chromosomal replication initiator protein
MNTEFVWKNCLDSVVQHVSPQHFSTWFRPIKVVGGDETSLELEVPNRFFLEWIKEHYLPLIQDVLRKTTNREYLIHWNVGKEDEKKPAVKKSTARAARARAQKKSASHGLSTKYTFENFVVGKANEFAHAACFAVSNDLSSKYNPLFIYGGVGLGKTHLLQGIGNRVLNNTSGTNICYYTSERFMNEFISYVSRNKMSDFRRKFRNVDLLLIDDIQFWGGKERTQEEFFHTFNSLYEAHKQIVVTSDKFPKDIDGIEERLRSRFEWGLVADIQPPDVEMKMAILRTKSAEDGVKLPDDVTEWLATASGSNVRELEGNLNRIIAYSSLTGQDITLQMSKETLKNLVKKEKAKILTIELIQKTVASYYNVKLTEMRSKRRHKAVALPRQVAMYISREFGRFSYPEIGTSFGGKDHSTVVYAYQKIDKSIGENGDIKRAVLAIKNTLL